MQQLVSNGLSRPVAVPVSFAFFKEFYANAIIGAATHAYWFRGTPSSDSNVTL